MMHSSTYFFLVISTDMSFPSKLQIIFRLTEHIILRIALPFRTASDLGLGLVSRLGQLFSDPDCLHHGFRLGAR